MARDAYLPNLPLPFSIQVKWDFSDKDRRSGLRKLEEASLSYMHNGARLTGTAGLRGFQGASLEPAVFREQVTTRKG